MDIVETKEEIKKQYSGDKNINMVTIEAGESGRFIMLIVFSKSKGEYPESFNGHEVVVREMPISTIH